MRTILALLFAVTLSAETLPRGVEQFRLDARGNWFVAATSDGSAWIVAEEPAGRWHFGLYRITPEGVLLQVVAARWDLSGPVAADEDAVWIAGYTSVLRYDRRTGALTETAIGDVVMDLVLTNGTLWVHTGDYPGTTRLVKVAANGTIIDTVEIPGWTQVIRASADGSVWATPASFHGETPVNALYCVSPSGSVTRIALPFTPLFAQSAHDSVWVTTKDGRFARVAFDGTVLSLSQPWRIVIPHGDVDAGGDFWFATERQGIGRVGRDGLLRWYPLPRLPHATCKPWGEPLPVDITPAGTMVMANNYGMCSNGPCPPYDPCVAFPPADFVMRSRVDAIEPYRYEALAPIRPRAVRSR